MTWFAGRVVVWAPVAVWLAAEAAHASATVIPANAGTPSLPNVTLLVLGCPADKDGRPSALQRWRVDLAARSAGAADRFLFTGAGEAGVMAADLIGRHGIDPARVTCENEATTTWENIANSAALIAPGGGVLIISDPLHVRRAQRYWRLQFPERAGELRSAKLYRFGEHPVLKVLTAAYSIVLRTLRYRPAGNRIWQRVEANR
ncbi:YdcF family protein [Micropruina sonneratiae]|uniref:YdcF family protein n=1 Tax=Micropruina sonneratiae TaxID=2986940 RepID=UPI0022271FD0|nr:YdcF family protein [Micropruina sp. KQZ13P-5]MCW3159533.1 YdcF family protein [Micropruina sp. KQZ13P-5]